MKEHIAYCGINCTSCKLYKASISGDMELRLKLAEEWGAQYKRVFDLDNLVCFGCKSKTIFELCSHCDIKLCNQEKEISNCLECKTYPCERLQRFINYQVENKTGVEIISKLSK